jgi:hypothetical protein
MPDGASVAPRAVASPPLQPSASEPVEPKVVAAAHELISFFLSRYAVGEARVHAESVIGAAAALTGEFAQRAANLPIPQGQAAFVFGDGINDILLEGRSHGRATVWAGLEKVARDCGVPQSEIPDPVEVIRNVAEAIGGPNFPPITVPKQHYPHEYSPNACPQLRPGVIDIADRLDLSRKEVWLALTMATGGLIHMTKNILPPAIGVRLATEIAFGVAKMAPLNEPIG